MKHNASFTKRDIFIVLLCTLSLLLNIAAIGSSGRRRAKEKVCLSNLQQWGTIFEMFTNDHDGYFNNRDDKLWMTALRPYYTDNLNLLLCPQASRAVESISDSGTFSAWWLNFNFPNEGQFHCISSYGINSWTNNMTHDYGNRLEDWFWKNVRGVKNKNTIPVFADSTWYDAWPRSTDSPPPHPDVYGIGNMGTTGEMNHFCIDRHNGAINLLFMDWAARKVGLKELWTLKWSRNFNREGPWTRAGGVIMWDWPEWMRNFKEY